MKKTKEEKVRDKWSFKTVRVFVGGKWQQMLTRHRKSGGIRHQGERECARRIKWAAKGIYDCKKVQS